MSTRKKLWISIGTLCIAIIAALGITCGVLATQIQRVKNTFVVEYKAINVNATVTATFSTKNDKHPSTNATYNFVPTDDYSSTPKTLTLDKAVLTADDSYVIYIYSFKNNNTGTNTRKMTVTFADNSAAGTNIKPILYAENTTGIAPTADADFNWDKSAITVNAGDTAYVFVKIAIDKNTLDSIYSLNLSWTLTSVDNGN